MPNEPTQRRILSLRNRIAVYGLYAANIIQGEPDMSNVPPAQYGRRPPGDVGFRCPYCNTNMPQCEQEKAIINNLRPGAMASKPRHYRMEAGRHKKAAAVEAGGHQGLTLWEKDEAGDLSIIGRMGCGDHEQGRGAKQ